MTTTPTCSWITNGDHRCQCPQCKADFAAYIADEEATQGKFCPMCDGGHGGSFCPLENTADYSSEPWGAI